MLKCDFHMHTKYSPDSDMEPEIIIRTALKRGLDVIGVVDHDIYKGGPETKKIAEKIAPELIVIPGEEIKTLSGEVIAFNLKRTIPKKMALADTVEEARGQGAFIIVPHPFDKLRQGVGENIDIIKDDIDAIEIFNARTMFHSFNMKARKYAEDNMIPIIAGSDSHFYYEIGAGYTLIDSERNEKDILESIKAGKTKIGGKKTGIRPHAGTFFQKKFGRTPV